MARTVYLHVAIDVDDDDPAFESPARDPAHGDPPNIDAKGALVSMIVARDVHNQICDIGYTGQVRVSQTCANFKSW
jgi:hypothetical protein